MKQFVVDLDFQGVAQIKNAIDPVDPQDYVTKAFGDANYVGGSSSIPELSVDPVSPAAQSAWVRATAIAAATPVGLLLAITKSSFIYTYEFRYRTLSGITVGAPLT